MIRRPGNRKTEVTPGVDYFDSSAETYVARAKQNGEERKQRQLMRKARRRDKRELAWERERSRKPSPEWRSRDIDWSV